MLSDPQGNVPMSCSSSFAGLRPARRLTLVSGTNRGERDQADALQFVQVHVVLQNHRLFGVHVRCPDGVGEGKQLTPCGVVADRQAQGVDEVVGHAEDSSEHHRQKRYVRSTGHVDEPHTSGVNQTLGSRPMGRMSMSPDVLLSGGVDVDGYHAFDNTLIIVGRWTE